MDCKGEDFYIRFLAATNKKTGSLSGNYLQMIAEKQKFNKVIGGYIRNTYRYQLFLELIAGLILLEMVGASRTSCRKGCNRGAVWFCCNIKTKKAAIKLNP